MNERIDERIDVAYDVATDGAIVAGEAMHQTRMMLGAVVDGKNVLVQWLPWNEGPRTVFRMERHVAVLLTEALLTQYAPKDQSATAEHLHDARTVRDRLLAIVERAR